MFLILTISYQGDFFMLIKLEVEKNLRERFEYRDSTFPFGVWTDVFNDFVDHTVNCHWHYDFEYGYVLSGTVDYYINDTFVELRKGDCFFVNSNMLHMGRQAKDCNDSVMFTITFPMSLLTTNIGGTVYSKYFEPVMGKQIEGFKITSDNSEGQEMRTLLTDIYSLDVADFGYELKCLKYVSALWLATLRHINNGSVDLLFNTSNAQYAERAKEILSYIHAHYHEKITIEDIARDTHISRSECFRCFKRFINKRPIAYINEYRLTKAIKLLRETEKNITEIYTECGFESASYFAKVFRDTYAASPLQYRKMK